MRRISLLFFTLLAGCQSPGTMPEPSETPSVTRGGVAVRYELVIDGGRVMDPASGLDAVRNVGIRRGRIAAISDAPLDGVRTIDAEGLVVAPGFIDLHVHGDPGDVYPLQVMDGVTSSLELEVGTADVDGWYDDREGRSPIHFGVSSGHAPVRMEVMDDPGTFLPAGAAVERAATDEELEAILAGVARGLEQGAVAVGIGRAYTPAATTAEIVDTFQVAARYDASVHVHMGGGSDRARSLTEIMAASVISGAPLHVVHINSSGGSAVQELLGLIARARAHGLDVTTECYPYTAGMTNIETALYDDWESWNDERFLRYQWVETGERLTRESFGRYREIGGEVISHGNPEEFVTAAVSSPLTMIASDAFMTSASRGHPRTAGTFSRVLGRYRRDKGVLGLMDALRKMTILPAERLEARVPEMARKGRIQVGADADITIFDPERILDRATYLEPTLPPDGIEHVLVLGVSVVQNRERVAGVLPGRAIRAKTP